MILRPLDYKGAEHIGIYFENYPSLNTIIRKKAGGLWSATYKCWHVPLNKENYNQIYFTLHEKVNLETGELVDYLNNRKKDLFRVVTKQEQKEPEWVNERAGVNFTGSKIDGVNANILPAMRERLKLKGYSESTLRTYVAEMSQFLYLLKDKPADALDAGHLKRYLVYCYDQLKLKENTLHSRINALKFYYEQVLGREKFFWEIPRPKKHMILPKVLGEHELRRLFSALTNKKHKAIVFTAYSAGLRVSEVVNLQLRHIDRDRMQIFIEKAKGKKDRYVMLSPVLLDILTAYFRSSPVKPLKYIFEGPVPGSPYSARSMQVIFQQARVRAGISKNVSFHSLRHSFATHLLEKGVDIKYIRDLLGHFDIRTTSIYLHVRKDQLVNIVSPLDDLIGGGLF